MSDIMTSNDREILLYRMFDKEYPCKHRTLVDRWKLLDYLAPSLSIISGGSGVQLRCSILLDNKMKGRIKVSTCMNCKWRCKE